MLYNGGPTGNAQLSRAAGAKERAQGEAQINCAELRCGNADFRITIQKKILRQISRLLATKDVCGVHRTILHWNPTDILSGTYKELID
jgi:hypothetical protein